jgi:eukaryotic-like serine/threonine-protein kinase
VANSKKTNREIFEEALQIDTTTARDAFLESACGGDPKQVRRVKALLRAHGTAGDFMSAEDEVGSSTALPSGRTPSTTVAATELIGTMVGGYKVLQEIGEGGFGVVYMAEQLKPVRRRVALKVIKPGMDTRQVVARFEAERQALALMSHPNIAQVLEAGSTEAGHPYFVMELVKGVSITDYCDQHKLSTRQRLELFLQVCSAIQHAHQKGVVHRDVKPSNILITLQDEKPVPKVIDFGIAKALNQVLTDKTVFTAYGQMIGTPQYTSPEQAEMSGLDIDTRSDIYSLGVLLYELLTGLTPIDRNEFKDAGFSEIQKLIREKEPTKPSMAVSVLCRSSSAVAEYRQQRPEHLISEIKGDLDWIVLKALEKDRSRRYSTANGFAEDIGRYLRNEPVGASPPTMGYLLGKFTRRHRRMMVAASAVFAALLIGAVGMTILFFEAESGRLEAEQATAVAKQERINADAAKAAESAQRELAQEYAARIKETFSQADFATAANLLEEQEDKDALAYLARSLRTDPGLRQSAQALVSALREGNFDLQPETIFRHEKPIEGFDLNQTGDFLLTRSTDGRARIWNANSYELLHDLGAESPLRTASFDLTGRRLITVSEDGIVRVFSLPSLAAIGGPILPDGGARGVRFAESPGGGLKLATLSATGALQIWDGLTGQALTEQLSLPDGKAVTHYRLSEDGSRLFGRDRSRWIGFWNTETGEATGAFVSLAGAAYVVDSVARRIACVVDSSRKKLRFFDLETGRQRNELKLDVPIHTEPILNTEEMRLIVQGRQARGGGSGGNVFLMTTFVIDWQKAEVIADSRNYLVETSRAQGLRLPVIHNGLGVSAHQEGAFRVVVRNLRSGAIIKKIELEHRLADTSRHSGLVFSPSGDLLAVNLADNRFALFWTTGRRVGICEPQKSAFNRLQFSPDGQRIVTVATDGGVQVWDNHSMSALTPVFHHTGSPEKIVFSTDGNRVFVADQSRRGAVLNHGAVRAWDVRMGRRLDWPLEVPLLRLRTFECSERNRMPLVTRAGMVLLLDIATREVVKDFSVDGARLVQARISRDDQRLVATDEDEVFVWDLNTGKLQHRFDPDGTVFHLRLNPQGNRVVTATTEPNVQIWDLDNGQSLTPPLPTEERIFQLDVRADGSQLLAATSADTLVWDLTADDVPASRRRVSSGPKKSFRAEFSPDGSKTLFIDLNTARILDAETGDLIASFSHGFELSSAHFSSDGRRLLVSGPPNHGAERGAGWAVVWDLDSRKQIVNLPHDAQVSRARFSPDGRMIVTLGQDKSLRIWDVELGQMLAPPIRHTAGVVDFQVTHDNRELVTLSASRVWVRPMPMVGPDVPEWLPDLAEAVAGRRIDERGQIELVPSQRLEDVRQHLAQLSANDDYGQFLKWFLADRSTRTITPRSDIEWRSYAQILLERDRSAAMRRALSMTSDNPDIYARMAEKNLGFSRADLGAWQTIQDWYAGMANKLAPKATP